MKLRMIPHTANTPLITKPRTSVFRDPDTNELREKARLPNENHLTLVLQGCMHMQWHAAGQQRGVQCPHMCAAQRVRYWSLQRIHMQLIVGSARRVPSL
jgi:hypothetical protein